VTAEQLYRHAMRRGLQLRAADGNRIGITPAHRLTPDFAEQLRAHKTELLRWLTNSGSRGWQSALPATLRLTAGHPMPNQADARRVMDYIISQIGDRPGPLCEWCLERENAYWATYNWPFDVCAYAAARDAACWQLQRTEQQLWEFLDAQQA
jgi:hypothetical protein